MVRNKKNKFVIFTLVFPGLFMFFAAIFFPIILSGYYGMTDSIGVGNSNFVGMKNFVKIFTNDPIFWKALFNSFLIGLAYILLQHPICIFFAILLDKVSGRLENVFRALFFIPCVISSVVVIKLWVFLYNPRFGAINKFLEGIGLGSLTQQWLVNPDTAFGSIIVMTIWIGFGWGLLLYYAGVKGIPNSLYEAAKIDGAGSWKMHLKITIPMLTPIIRVNVTLAMINALKQMEIIYLSTNGGPINKTEVVANYLYKKAFTYFEYGYANAISIVFVIICLLVVVIFNKLINRDIGV